MNPFRRRTFTAMLASASLLAGLCSTATAGSPAKAIWGPTDAEAFRNYKALGAGIYVDTLRWADVAGARPRTAADPADPAYSWPTRTDEAVERARANGMQVALVVLGTPAWANGGRSQAWAPRRASDYAAFMKAASRRYAYVKFWQVWGEPSREQNFEPLIPEGFRGRGKPLPAAKKVAPRRYSQLLDAAYGALKSVGRRDVVIGGSTFTTGDISPRNWIRNLRLPNGRAPRMDMYGHNPFSGRKPRLSKPPLDYGFADFSDLDTVAKWLDRYVRPRMPGRKRLKLFLSEFTIPTDHKNFEFNFWVDQPVQADWLSAALKIVRRSPRIYTVGWIGLYDDQPNPQGTEVNRGLLTYKGEKKPSYNAYKRG